MPVTGIEWTDMRWNPVHGCSKVSEGCRGCYAERDSHRWGHTEQDWTIQHAEENVTVKTHKFTESFPPRSSENNWLNQAPGDHNAPDGYHPTRVFVNSMSDLFHEQVPTEAIVSILDNCRDNPHAVFQILTKHGAENGRLEELAPHLDWPPNVWLGVSVEHRRRRYRIDQLRDVPVDVRFVSFEPLVGNVGADVDLDGIEWAIVGGESGHTRREMEHEWACALLDAAREHGTRFFFKQSSGPRPGMNPKLSVPNDHGFYEQRVIREFPRPDDSVLEANDWLEAAPGGESA